MMCLPASVGLVRPGSGANPYLDGLATQPKAVCSLKKLISTATVAIRVRRSSDSAEQDIGFSGNSLDTTSLASFVGSDSAYITTFYDQTGSGYHLTQATASKQPRIVNAGAYDGIAIFDGTDDGMVISSLALSQPQMGFYYDGTIPATAGVSIVAEASANWNSNTYCFNINSQSSDYQAGMNSGVAATQRAHTFTSASWGMSSRRILSVLFDRSATGTAEIVVYTGGGLRNPSATINNEMSGSFATHDVYVGARAASSFYAAITVFSLVFYDADTASLRATIEGRM